MATVKKTTDKKIKVMWLMSDQSHSYHGIYELTEQEYNLLINKGIFIPVKEELQATDD